MVSQCRVFCGSAAKGVQRQLAWPDVNRYDLLMSVSFSRETEQMGGGGGGREGEWQGEKERERDLGSIHSHWPPPSFKLKKRLSYLANYPTHICVIEEFLQRKRACVPGSSGVL